MDRRARRIADTILLTVAGVVITVVVAQWVVGDVAWPGPFQDWRTYANAVSRWLDGQSIYAPAQLSGPYSLNDVVVGGYAYTPASVPLFLPFASYPLGLTAWIVLNVGSLLTAVWALTSHGWPEMRVPIFSLAIIGLAVFPPFLVGVLSMNANVGIAGLVGWTAAGLGLRSAAGLGAIAGVMKVFAGVVALGTDSKFGSTLRAATICLLVVIVTLPFVGIESWINFFVALRNSVPDCRFAQNLSIACELAPLIGVRGGVLAGLVVAALAGVALMFVRDRLWMAVLVAVVVAAPAYNLHAHYWIMAYVLLIAALARVAEVRRDGERSRGSLVRVASAPG